MWRDHSLYIGQEVWYHDEVLHSQLLVAVDSLLQLGVDRGLRGVDRARDHHPPLGLVVPALGVGAVGLQAPPSVALGDLVQREGPGDLAALRGGDNLHCHQRHQVCGWVVVHPELQPLV